MCVLGSIQELGKWKEYKHAMKWTEGDVWVSKEPLITNSFFFSYKYSWFEKEGYQLVGWERGVDRIADLEIMPDFRTVGRELDALANNNECLYNAQNCFENYGTQDGLRGATNATKHIQFNDEWESY